MKKIVAAALQKMGLDASIYDETFLENATAKFCSEHDFKSPAQLLKAMDADRSVFASFSRSLSITYSEFFRHALTFAALENVLLPGLVLGKTKAGQHEIRVWSAGCAAGQEAYSLAILLDELIADHGSGIHFRIFATDHSATELTVARAGQYEAGFVHNVRLKHLQNYFTVHGGLYAIQERLQERVVFSSYDLLDIESNAPPESIFGDFDLVLCCNLLFYYQPAIRQRILDKVHRSLASGGILVTGDTEGDIVSKHKGFVAALPPASIFYKQSGQVRA